MPFRLRRHTIGSKYEVKISKEDFLSLQYSKSFLEKSSDIEKLYTIVMLNYESFERKILTLSLMSMLGKGSGYDVFNNYFIQIDMKIMNLLSSARSYLDQLGKFDKKILKHIFGRSIIEKLTSYQYDEKFSYRFVEALRNYIQHHGLPVNSITIRHNNSAINNLYKETGITIYCEKCKIGNDKDFKKTILDEMNEKVDILKCIREYVESLSIIQCDFRDSIEYKLQESRDDITKAIVEYTNYGERSEVGILAERVEGEEITKIVPLVLKWDDERIKLAQKNIKQANLGKCYVTGRLFEA